jgi:hypothetical protein
MVGRNAAFRRQDGRLMESAVRPFAKDHAGESQRNAALGRDAAAGVPPYHQAALMSNQSDSYFELL